MTELNQIRNRIKEIERRLEDKSLSIKNIEEMCTEINKSLDLLCMEKNKNEKCRKR